MKLSEIEEWCCEKHGPGQAWPHDDCAGPGMPSYALLLRWLRESEAKQIRYVEALKEISQGRGAFALNPLEHCGNCVEEMKALALKAIQP